jgi:hypothetical protein
VGAPFSKVSSQSVLETSSHPYPSSRSRCCVRATSLTSSLRQPLRRCPPTFPSPPQTLCPLMKPKNPSVLAQAGRPAMNAQTPKTQCRRSQSSASAYSLPRSRLPSSMPMPCSTSKCSSLICRPCSSSHSVAVPASGTLAQRIGLWTLTSMQARAPSSVAQIFRTQRFVQRRSSTMRPQIWRSIWENVEVADGAFAFGFAESRSHR